MEDMRADLAELRSRGKSNTRRLDEAEKRLNDLKELTTSVKVLALRQERVESDVREIKADVRELAAKPARRWEGAMDKLLAALAGAFTAWLLAGGVS